MRELTRTEEAAIKKIMLELLEGAEATMKQVQEKYCTWGSPAFGHLSDARGELDKAVQHIKEKGRK